MKLSSLVASLWGENAKFRWLFLAAIILFCTFLGAKEIWTQEHRWADIVAGMFYRHDFFHPYLGEARYYDKPLLSYWLIAALAWLFDGLNTWALRLPSALAGLLAVWSIYRIGSLQRGNAFGLLCGWMLTTTFFILFWGRVSSADMLNVGGILFAVAWYMGHKNRPSYLDYSVFFIIIAVTSLCKGLVGAIVALIAVAVDMWVSGSIRRHLTLKLLFATVPALVVYLIPFFLSSHFGGEAYGQNGLYLVYKENVLRYFQPFDHQGPIYTYFIYLPLYLMPWTLFFIPALVSLPGRWKNLSIDARWNVLATTFIFLFFTLSGSRRSYYVLPIVPFAILMTADWIAAVSVNALRQKLAAACAIISAMLILVVMDVMPAWYYGNCGIGRFATSLKHEAEKQQPWRAWRVIMLDAESKLNFYLGLPPGTKNFDIEGERRKQTLAALKKRWTVLKAPAADAIIISRKQYAPVLDQYFPMYIKVTMPRGNCQLLGDDDSDMPIAYIPILKTAP